MRDALLLASIFFGVVLLTAALGYLAGMFP